jgi:hypothetical protein
MASATPWASRTARAVGTSLVTGGLIRALPTPYTVGHEIRGGPPVPWAAARLAGNGLRGRLRDAPGCRVRPGGIPHPQAPGRA